MSGLPFLAKVRCSSLYTKKNAKKKRSARESERRRNDDSSVGGSDADAPPGSGHSCMMGESIGTYLMPLHAVVSWYLLYTQGDTGKFILPVALSGWVWAGINILRTKRLDLGVFTFFFVILASLFERQYGLTPGIQLALCCSSALVAVNFSLPNIFWSQIRKAITRRKGDTWSTIFRTYCACMTVFWLLATARTRVRIAI